MRWLLRDVFVWAYACSCRQYVAVRRQLVPPDTLRLRYRNELAATVRAIVQGGQAADRTAIGAAVPAAVAAVDRERFIGMVINEFTHLHHGNVVRFGLRAMEFQAWQAGPGMQ